MASSTAIDFGFEQQSSMWLRDGGCRVSKRLRPFHIVSSTSADDSSKPDDDRNGYLGGKVQRMLERKIDLWPPEEVFELLPILLQGDDLEKSIDDRISTASAKEAVRLEYSKAFVINLKRTEQERLSRQWLEQILEAATLSTESMDQLIFELTQDENARLIVEPLLETLDQMLRRLQETSPDEKTLTQVVVETIKKRIEAEIATTDRPYVRLLAALLRLETPEERERLLRAELRSTSLIVDFADFVEEGADYVARLRLGPYRLSEDTPERMKELLVMLRGFVGGDVQTSSQRLPPE